MENITNPFETVATTVPDRNLFDLSYENRFTAAFGELIPCYLQETLPGDTFELNQELFVRFQPMLAPLMQRIDAYVHYFFVPNRLCYKDWNQFIVGGPDGTDTEHFILPFMRLSDILMTNPDQHSSPAAGYRIAPSTLADYMGIPTTEFHGQTDNQGNTLEDSANTGYLSLRSGTFGYLDDIHINMIPFRGYQLIYDEYYRDENLIQSDLRDDILNTGSITTDGGQITNNNEMRALLKTRWRAFKKDYFTSALPWQQKGPSVVLPIAGTAPFTGLGYVNYRNMPANPGPGFVNLAFNPGNSGSGDVYSMNIMQAGTNTLVSDSQGNDADAFITTQGIASLNQINSTTLNDFRVALKTQEWLEKNARGGTRYIETLLCHFGVMTPDARLQRPEYITGCKVPVMISDVEQNGPSFEYAVPDSDKTAYKTTTPLGMLAGKAIAEDGNNGNFKYYSYEHGYLIGILSIMPKASYSQGLPRHFSRLDKFDYYWPSFAHLGEQAVKNKEIYLNYCQQTDNQGHIVEPEDEFGYQSRYVEYKTRQDEIHGDFKSTLDYWHMSRFFAQPPMLNQEFIEARAVNFDEEGQILDYGDFNRAFAVQSEWKNQILVDMYFDVKALRCIPRYSVPSF